MSLVETLSNLLNPSIQVLDTKLLFLSGYFNQLPESHLRVSGWLADGTVQ